MLIGLMLKSSDMLYQTSLERTVKYCFFVGNKGLNALTFELAYDIGTHINDTFIGIRYALFLHSLQNSFTGGCIEKAQQQRFRFFIRKNL